MRLDEIEKICEATTPGPWEPIKDEREGHSRFQAIGPIAADQEARAPAEPPPPGAGTRRTIPHDRRAALASRSEHRRQRETARASRAAGCGRRTRGRPVEP